MRVWVSVKVVQTNCQTDR